MKVAVSYLKSKEDLESTIKNIESSSADYIHVDLMDGVFVENKNDDLSKHVDALKKCKKKLDVHLMMQGQALLRGIEAMSLLNPEYITIHSELENLDEMLTFIKKKGIKVGLAINPGTYTIHLRPHLKEIDKIIVMSVYPGKGGQSFLEETTSKLSVIREMIEDGKYPIDLEVDGGINDETARKVMPYVDTVVSGSYICMSEDMEKQINKLKSI
ncbi:MAG: ribulose-phosphate 3-epimerase [Bacilli bacterium]|nr:ribulose-phosphate 3-epimerase [Bacilli bacterium]